MRDGICRRTLARLARLPVSPAATRYSARDRSRVARAKALRRRRRPPQAQIGHARILPGGNILRIFLYDAAGAIEGIAEYRARRIASVVDNPAGRGRFRARAGPGRPRDAAARQARQGALARRDTADFPLHQRRICVSRSAPGRAGDDFSEILVILAPVLMWLWASVVGWVLVQRLLLQPLGRIQNVISAYRPGDRGVRPCRQSAARRWRSRAWVRRSTMSPRPWRATKPISRPRSNGRSGWSARSTTA